MYSSKTNNQTQTQKKKKEKRKQEQKYNTIQSINATISFPLLPAAPKPQYAA